MMLVQAFPMQSITKVFGPWWSFSAPLRYTRAKSTSSKRWLERQKRDPHTLKSHVDNYKSRAAYKLVEFDKKFNLFSPGQTVVDLGFAPGSWSQVAQKATSPGGRVIGVDLLFTEPPLGVTAIQGNFLDPGVQLEVETILANPRRGRYVPNDNNETVDSNALLTDLSVGSLLSDETKNSSNANTSKADVVISDMCGIWPQQSGFWTSSINHSYRLANTSGIVARDHTSSIDLCDAALVFAIKNLKLGGSFVCKFYTGSEDGDLEKRLQKVFRRVRRVKPDASRSASREAYFIALDKKEVTDVASVFAE